MDLTHRSDDQLLLDVGELVGSHRVVTAKLVVHLAEIEERRLHLQAGFPSMFEFCVRELGFSEGEAFRRILAARLFVRFPVVYDLLAAGKVHLSALELLREHVTDENHSELLETVAGMSKREVETYLAARFPKPDAPSRITRSRIQSLSETRFKVEFTASGTLREKLELCRDLMSHANPSRDLAVVIERAVDLLIHDLERKRLARAKRPRRRTTNQESPISTSSGRGGNPRSTPRRVTSEARREVFERDGLACTYVSPNGRRCGSRAFMELDHAEPRALGGADSAENLRVRCRAHNQHAAEQVFGREHVQRSAHFRQQKRQRCNAPEVLARVIEDHLEQDLESDSNENAQSAESLWGKVRVALIQLGFRVGEARRAIAEARKRHSRTPPLKLAVREALLVATTGIAAKRGITEGVTYGFPGIAWKAVTVSRRPCDGGVTHRTTIPQKVR
jgi:5-methylcytosine-specific restriction endonuclease McrA